MPIRPFSSASLTSSFWMARWVRVVGSYIEKVPCRSTMKTRPSCATAISVGSSNTPSSRMSCWKREGSGAGRFAVAAALGDGAAGVGAAARGDDGEEYGGTDGETLHRKTRCEK